MRKCRKENRRNRLPLTIEGASSHMSSGSCPFHLFICGTSVLLLYWSQNMFLRPAASAWFRNLNQKRWGSFRNLVKFEEPLSESTGPQHQLHIELCGEFLKHQFQDPTPRDFDEHDMGSAQPSKFFKIPKWFWHDTRAETTGDWRLSLLDGRSNAHHWIIPINADAHPDCLHFFSFPGSFTIPLQSQFIWNHTGSPHFPHPTHSSVHSNLNSTFFFGHSTQHAGPSFPEQGLNPCALQWELRVVSTGPRGKSRNSVLVTMQSALTSVAKSNCCSPTLIIPFHFPSLLNKYTFFSFVMLRTLVFPPPEWPFFGESVFLFQTAVGWTCPGLILGSLSFRHTLSKEVLIPSLGSEYYLHRHLLPTPYFYLSFRFKLHFPFSLVILSDITIFMCNSLEWVSAFCENCMRLLFLCFIIVCCTGKI